VKARGWDVLGGAPGTVSGDLADAESFHAESYITMRQRDFQGMGMKLA